MSNFKIRYPGGEWRDPGDNLRIRVSSTSWERPKAIYRLAYVETRAVENQLTQTYTHYEWKPVRHYAPPGIQHPAPTLHPAGQAIDTLESWLDFPSYSDEPNKYLGREIEYERMGTGTVVRRSSAGPNTTRDLQLWESGDWIRARMCFANEAGPGPWSEWSNEHRFISNG